MNDTARTAQQMANTLLHKYLMQTYPIFRKPYKPVKVGVDAELRKQLKGRFDDEVVEQYLGGFFNGVAYLTACLFAGEDAFRVDLNGEPTADRVSAGGMDNVVRRLQKRVDRLHPKAEDLFWEAKARCDQRREDADTMTQAYIMVGIGQMGLRALGVSEPRRKRVRTRMQYAGTLPEPASPDALEAANTYCEGYQMMGKPDAERHEEALTLVSIGSHWEVAARACYITKSQMQHLLKDHAAQLVVARGLLTEDDLLEGQMALSGKRAA